MKGRTVSPEPADPLQPLIVNFSCEEGTSIDAGTCTKSANMGWRYTLITLGGLTLLMFIARFVCFTLYESPKYLIAKGKDAAAVKVVHQVAAYNKVPCELTIEHLQAVDAKYPEDEKFVSNAKGTALLRESLSKFNLSHIKALFSTRRMALSTSLVISCWALIGKAPRKDCSSYVSILAHE